VTQNEGAMSMRIRVLLTAIYMFSERGFEATTMRAIAAGVGVKAPAIYKHFESKEDLLTEAVCWSMDEFVHSVVDQVDASNDEPSEALRALIQRHVLYTILHGDEASGSNLLGDLDKLINFLPRDAHARVEGQMRNYLERVCVLMGAITGRDPRDPDLRLIALSTLTMCDRVAIWYRKDGPFSPTEVADRHWLNTEALLGRLIETAESSPDV
jgi:AcrR family transcriptional regulator